MTARTKVVLTVDTEPSIAGAFANPEMFDPLIDQPVWGDVNGTSEALGFMTRTLARHRQQATFFVETCHTNYFPESSMGAYVEHLMSAGQDVQLHVHPCWLSFENGKRSDADQVTDHCSALELEQLAEILNAGCAQILSWTGRRPTGMRTGNFATGRVVYSAMARVGLTNASNICLASNPPVEAELALAGGSHVIEGIRELPVTSFIDRGPVGRGGFRPMQVTSLSIGEQTNLLRRLHARGDAVVVIVTHPFEFLKAKDFRYTHLRPNRLVQRRFEQLCEFLAVHEDMFEVTTLENAATATTDTHEMLPLEGNAGRAFLRAAQNAINDRI